MAKFWRRKARQDTHTAQPAHNAQPAALPADLAAWAREADVSRLSDQTIREAEDYLNKYRHMNLDLSQQMGWRVMSAVEAQVTPSPPPFAQPLDVIATVLALKRKQLGTGLSSPSALVLPSLGYEASGSGLLRLGRSPLCRLTSASVWEVVVYGALHLSRLSRARRVSFTDWFYRGCEVLPALVQGRSWLLSWSVATSCPELGGRGDYDERGPCHYDGVGNHAKPMELTGWPSTELGERTGQGSTNSEQDANPLPPEIRPPPPAAGQVQHKHCHSQEPGSR